MVSGLLPRRPTTAEQGTQTEARPASARLIGYSGKPECLEFLSQLLWERSLRVTDRSEFDSVDGIARINREGVRVNRRSGQTLELARRSHYRFVQAVKRVLLLLRCRRRWALQGHYLNLLSPAFLGLVREHGKLRRKSFYSTSIQEGETVSEEIPNPKARPKPNAKPKAKASSSSSSSRRASTRSYEVQVTQQVTISSPWGEPEPEEEHL